MIDLKEFNADNVLHYIAADPEEWLRNFVRSRIKIAEIEMIKRGLDPNDKRVQLPDLDKVPGMPRIVTDITQLSDDIRHTIARNITYDKKISVKSAI